MCRRRGHTGYDPSDSLFEDLAKELATLCAEDDNGQYPEPDAVADAVLPALFSDQPKGRYLAITDRRHAECTIRNALAELVQLSQNHPFRFERDELIAMLDEALQYPQDN